MAEEQRPDDQPQPEAKPEAAKPAEVPKTRVLADQDPVYRRLLASRDAWREKARALMAERKKRPAEPPQQPEVRQPEVAEDPLDQAFKEVLGL